MGWERSYKPWSEAEIDTLRAHAGETTTAIADAMARRGRVMTLQAVREACVRFGVKYAPRGGTGWPADQIEMVRALAAKGHTASAIARELAKKRPGVTRNAVIAQCHRRGIKLKGSLSGAEKTTMARANLGKPPVARTPKPPKPKPPKLKNPGKTKFGQPAPALNPPPPTKGAPGAFDPLPGVAPVAFDARTPFQCAWPIGDFDSVATHCCGAIATDRCYCEAHHKLSLARYVPSYLQDAEKVAA